MEYKIGIEGCTAYGQLDNHRYLGMVKKPSRLGWLIPTGVHAEYDGTFRLNCGDRSGQTQYFSGENHSVYPVYQAAIDNLCRAICQGCPNKSSEVS